MKDLTLVFDLDGTLVNTAPDLTAATNHVLEHVGLAPISAAELLPLTGQGAKAMVDRALGPAGEKFSEAEHEALLARFFDYYGRHVAVSSQPYEGTIEALEHLSREGAKLAVCTNKKEDMSRALLDALDMTKYFAAIAGRDTLPVSKPDPGHLLGTIEMAGGKADRAVMVGDSRTDIATAKAANVPVIAVSFGYTDTPVRELDPDIVIDHYSELLAAIAALKP